MCEPPEASSNRGTISAQHRPPMYHLTPVLKAMTLSPIRAIIHPARSSLSRSRPPLRRAPFSLSAGRPANALRAGPAFLLVLLPRPGITDRPARRGARVKLSPRISRSERRTGRGSSSGVLNDSFAVATPRWRAFHEVHFSSRPFCPRLERRGRGRRKTAAVLWFDGDVCRGIATTVKNYCIAFVGLELRSRDTSSSSPLD